MNWKTDPNLETPPSRQIVARALDAIAGGDLICGDALPSVRKMAAEALVNHNTAARAYRELEVLGVVQAATGLGVFVTKQGPSIARKKRKEQTLIAVERALEEALRAGHDIEKLQKLMARLMKRTG
ncbi:MAG: GntR family transcriptional regulator [Planctomycetota bacterium]|jgi:GntR family transcriptional regulator